MVTISNDRLTVMHHRRSRFRALIQAVMPSSVQDVNQEGVNQERVNQVNRGSDDSTVGVTLQRIIETGLIFACFAAFAGQLPPDVNESHYLTKAKHFWDPDWAAGDLFLGSSFAHWGFYLIAGWLTTFMSLAAVAWTGRIVTWGLLAFAWQRLSWKLVPARWMSVVSSLFFLLLNDQFHLAGEWVVGGFEAKGLAYFFVLLALGNMIGGNWRWVWSLLGFSMAFHVLVGGWAFLAAIITWFSLNWHPDEDRPRHVSSLFSKIKSQALPLMAGLTIGAIGVIPPLWADVSATPETAAAARMIYVNHRIAHHLTFDAFPTLHVARFTLMIVFWFLLDQWIKKRSPPLHHKMKPIFFFGAGSLLFSFGGLLISGIAEQNVQLAVNSASLLRFYWFRLSDFAIPAGVAISGSAIIWYWLGTDPRFRTRLSCAVFVVCIVGASGFSIMKKYEDPRPRADRRWSTDFSHDPIRAVETYQNWRKVCQWISENTSRNASFITPADQQTFKWYAGRREVVCWKDVPQDANGIIEWRERLIELYEPQLRYANGMMSFSDNQLRDMARRYEATHLLVPQRHVDSTATPTGLKQVYPVDAGEKTTFVVFEF